MTPVYDTKSYDLRLYQYVIQIMCMLWDSCTPTNFTACQTLRTPFISP